MKQLPEMKTLVRRLESGNLQAEYVNRILLFVREKTYGQHLVKEMGDMIAHKDQRDKGVFAAEVRSFVNYLNLHTWFIQKVEDSNGRSTLTIYPGITDGIEAAFVKMPTSALKKYLNLKRPAAQKMVASICKSITDSGDHFADAHITRKEKELFLFLASNFNFFSTFEGHHFLDALDVVLTKNKIVDCGLQSLEARSFILLYLLSKMHGAEVPIKGFSNASLEINNKDGKLACNIKTQWQTDHPDSDKLFISAPFLITDLDVAEHTVPGLFDKIDGFRAIEIDSNQKLSVMDN